MYPNASYGGQSGGYGGQPGSYGGQPGGYGGQPGGHGGPPGGHGGPPGGHGGPPGSHGGPPGGHGGYGGYNPMGGFPGTGASPEIQQWFNTVDRDKSGKINGAELRSALVNAQGKNFSEPACQLMIGMFDHDKSGTIDINEFQQLYMYINQWLHVFRTYDRDNSGHIEEQELASAMQQMGFRFSPDFIKFLIFKSDLENHRQMSVDQFIVACVQIQRFTEAFRQRDKEMKGMITIGFEEFLQIALNCTS